MCALGSSKIELNSYASPPGVSLPIEEPFFISAGKHNGAVVTSSFSYSKKKTFKFSIYYF